MHSISRYLDPNLYVWYSHIPCAPTSPSNLIYSGSFLGQRIPSHFYNIHCLIWKLHYICMCFSLMIWTIWMWIRKSVNCTLPQFSISCLFWFRVLHFAIPKLFSDLADQMHWGVCILIGLHWDWHFSRLIVFADSAIIWLSHIRW